VPEWPIRLVPSWRRATATTSCDVGPAGLSTTAKPHGSAVVVVRSWSPPEDPTVEQEQQAQPTETLVEGLLSGLQQADVPVVGVETTAEDASAIDLYRTQGVSSVDDVETLAGRVALALLLGGGTPGHYGVKDSATDGVAPPVPVPVPSG